MTDMLFNPPQNVTNFLGFLNYTNYMTDIGSGGILGVGILLAVFFGIFLIAKSFSVDRAFVPAALIASFVALFLRILGLINDVIFYLCLIVLIFAIYTLFHARSNEEFS